MRNLVRCFAWVCLPLLQFALAAHAHGAMPLKPLLGTMMAIQVSLGALQPKLGDGVVGAIRFDPATGVWQFRFDRGQGTAPPTLEITLDESTGEICAHVPASGTCVARGSAAAQLKEARDKRAAQDEAVQHPAPDLQGVMIALVRYQAQAKDGYLRANPMPLYVSLNWPDGSRSIDLSEAAIRQLAGIGQKVFAASALLAPSKGTPEATRMVMSVGLPLPRTDGDYDVYYGFYCGVLCASWHMAVLHWDGKGWHVLISRMTGIS